MPLPSTPSYNTAMKAAGSAQQINVAFDLYHEMRSRGIEPTAATFGTLLNLAAEGGAWDKVVEAWGWLQGSGLPAHVGCANIYLGALLSLVSMGFGRDCSRGYVGGYGRGFDWGLDQLDWTASLRNALGTPPLHPHNPRVTGLARSGCFLLWRLPPYMRINLDTCPL